MKPDILSFRQAVYDVVRAIPPGRVLSYGVVASLAGWPNHARQVGHVLAHVPQSLNLPCHRVVGSDGRLSSVFAAQHELPMFIAIIRLVYSELPRTYSLSDDMQRSFIVIPIPPIPPNL